MKFGKLLLMTTAMILTVDAAASQPIPPVLRRNNTYTNRNNPTKGEIIVMIPLKKLSKRDPSVRVPLGDTSLPDLMKTVKETLKAYKSRNPLLEKAINESKVDLDNLQLWDWENFRDHPSSIENVKPGSTWYAADEETRDAFVNGKF